MDSDHSIYLQASSDVDDKFKSDWCQLFMECYGVCLQKAERVFKKYEMNSGRFCYLMQNDRLVACYSGLEVEFGKVKVLLSTDTMSNGLIKSSTVKMANYLYDRLKSEGFVAVVGYPNENIRMIRQRKLGWKMVGELYLWVGVPFLSDLSRKPVMNKLWNLKRPSSGFFSISGGWLRLISRDREYGPKWGVPFTLAAKKPGLLYFRVWEGLVRRKTFGYVVIGNSPSFEGELLEHLSCLDVNTIDLP